MGAGSAGSQDRPSGLALAREILEDMPEMIGCNGMCWRSCGPITATPVEMALIHDAHPLVVELGIDEEGGCLYLDHKRCSVYAERPLVCRMWGATRKMPCPFGCKPERWVTEDGVPPEDRGAPAPDAR